MTNFTVNTAVYYYKITEKMVFDPSNVSIKESNQLKYLFIFRHLLFQSEKRRKMIGLNCNK